MTDDLAIEILAMNIRMGVFGITALTDDWLKWAKANPQEAQALRDQAAAMIGQARSSAKPGTTPPARTSHHHSLGWLFS